VNFDAKNAANNTALAPGAQAQGDIGARLMLATLCFIWGTTWSVMRVVLYEVSPLSMRAVSSALGALTLYLVCVFMRRSLRVSSAKAWVHIFIASQLNIVGFCLLGTFAQLTAATGRVTILAYTMPVWSVLLAWPVLGERPNRLQAVALALCATGLAILVYPLTGHGLPPGIALAALTGFSWAAGTIYLKWAHIEGDTMGIASWQLTIAFVTMTAFMFVVEGHPDFSRARWDGWAGIIWTGVAGNGIAYALWFPVVRRLSTVAASVGVLAVPVIGVVQAFLILGEVPTAPDMVGFALIFAASALVLLTRQATAEPEP
jgi:drug/metabolite transporter (DMT)-like permease